MIKIGDAEPFAVGEERSVYYHPEDNGKCIKIALEPPGEDFRPAGFRDWLFWISRQRNSMYFDCNYTDALFFEKLQEREDPHSFDHLPRFYGLVETDLGLGLICELIRNEDGTPCESLKEYWLMNNGLTEERVVAAIYEFLAWTVKENIFLRQIGPTNMLMKKFRNGAVKIYHIDAGGCLDLIPLANYIEWFSRLRVAIKVNHFKRRKLNKRMIRRG